MKFSHKIEACGLSPMRKFHPYAASAQERGRRIYQLNIGQPDIETPPSFLAAVRRFRPPVLAYAPSPGVPEFLESVRSYYENLGIRLDNGDILAATGGSEALMIALACILDDGDEILVPEPFYPNYNTFARLTGGAIHPIPTRAEEGYHYAQREKIEAEIGERTRAILVSNPGNPTGAVLSEAEMRLLADIAKEHDLFLIADEVYREFVYTGERLSSMLEFEDAAEHVIVIDSVSKRFSACGARVGVLISRNKEFMAHALKYCQGRLSAATLDQIGAAALYQAGAGYFTAVREEYQRRRDICMEKLRQIPGVVCQCPKGAFYVMAALPVDDTDQFQIWLLEEFEDHGETVMFAPGEGFYSTAGKGKQEIRIAYVLSREKLARALDLLALAIQQYNAR